MNEDCKPGEVCQQGVDIRRTTLDGQRAIVTGADSGIGEAVARGLAEAGAAVVNGVNGEAHALQVVEDIRGAGGTAIAVPAGVSDEVEVQAMFRRAIDEFGSVDMLVNSAGLQQVAPLHEMTLAQTMAQTMAQTLAALKIRVNAISRGAIKTPKHRGVAWR